MTNILCFGDSVTFGEQDIQGGGWVERLKRFYFLQSQAQNQLWLQTRVYNLGIAGETTDGLYQRFSSELKSRLIKGQNNWAVLAYGANDLVQHKGKNRVPEQYFIRNLEASIQAAKKHKVKILLLGCLPIANCDDGEVNCHGDLRFNETLFNYNQIITELAAINKCEFLDLFSLFNENKNVWLATDGLHPNSQGHEFIFEQIKQSLIVT